MVLVFEDLQWADDGLLEFVDALVERVAGVPLLVVCSARPELLERRSDWGGGKRNALTISLPPLSEEDTARLLADLLERPVLPAEEQTALLQRAGGNPLYAEEYARILEAGTSVGDVPETLQGVVTARIDALPGEEKEVLQQAAVLGKVFWTDALEKAFAIDAWVLEERLHALERKEFVRREHRSAVAGARQYVFVHALVRDGAYGQMPRAARAGAHERVSDWIDRLPADRAEDRAEMLAHHLVQAVEYGRAAGLDVSSLVSRAGRALVEAGDRAWRLGVAGGALSFYEHARSLDPALSADPYFLLKIGTTLLFEKLSGVAELEQAAAALAEPDPATAAVAVMTAGEVHWQRGDHDGAFAYFDRAAVAVETLPQSREKLDVMAQLARFLTLAGRQTEGLARAEEAIAMAQEMGDDDLLIDLLNTRGLVRMHFADTAWLADLESSLALALERGSFRAGRSYLNLGSSLLSQAADVRRSHSVTREGLQFTEKLGGFKASIRWFHANLAESGFHLGEWGESLELVEQELADPEPSYLQPQCLEVRAHIRLVRGDLDGALADAERAAEEARAIVDPQAYLPALATLAFVSGRTQHAERAGLAIDELAALLEGLGPSGGTGGAWVVDLALALLELGREHELLDVTVPRGNLHSLARGCAGDRARTARGGCRPPRHDGIRRLRVVRQARRRSPPVRRGTACRGRAPAHARARVLPQRGRHGCDSRRGVAARCRELAAAAAELDRGLAGRVPVVDAAVRDRAGVVAARGEDARGDCGARPGLADRDQRPVVGQLGRAERDESVRDVPAARDVARVALVPLAHVDQLGAVGEDVLELVDAHQLERL